MRRRKLTIVSSPQPSTSAAAADSEDESADDQTDWHPVTEIVGCKNRGGKRFYKVKWADTTFPPSWIKEEDVSQALKDLYHVKHTWDGRIRKRY